MYVSTQNIKKWKYRFVLLFSSLIRNVPFLSLLPDLNENSQGRLRQFHTKPIEKESQKHALFHIDAGSMRIYSIYTLLNIFFWIFAL